MYCTKCGHEMYGTETECPFCGEKSAVPKTKTPTTWKSVMATGCLSIMMIVGLPVFLVLYSMIIAFFAVLPWIWGLCPKCGSEMPDHAHRCRVCQTEKKSKIRQVLPSVLVGLPLLILFFVAAMMSFPEWIRQIPGEQFVWLYFIYAVVVYAAAFGLQLLCTRVTALRRRTPLLDMQYSDSDLMVLRADRQALMLRYYLNKAIRHGVLRLTTVQDEEDSAPKTIVSLNPNLLLEKLELFCANNPQIGRIVTFVQEKMYAGEEATLTDVVRNVAPKPVLQSPGGIAAANLLIKTNRLIKGITCGAAILAWYPGITKLIMGLNYGKPVRNLMFVLVFVLAIHGTLKLLQTHFLYARRRRWVEGYILRSKHRQLPVYSAELEDAVSKAVSAANKAAEAERKKSSGSSESSGCGGCGCGGCGSCGGCGGCGGCGD